MRTRRVTTSTSTRPTSPPARRGAGSRAHSGEPQPGDGFFSNQNPFASDAAGTKGADIGTVLVQCTFGLSNSLQGVATAFVDGRGPIAFHGNMSSTWPPRRARRSTSSSSRAPATSPGARGDATHTEVDGATPPEIRWAVRPLEPAAQTPMRSHSACNSLRGGGPSRSGRRRTGGRRQQRIAAVGMGAAPLPTVMPRAPDFVSNMGGMARSDHLVPAAGGNFGSLHAEGADEAAASRREAVASPCTAPPWRTPALHYAAGMQADQTCCSG